jgi:hypothetical protein
MEARAIYNRTAANSVSDLLQMRSEAMMKQNIGKFKE